MCGERATSIHAICRYARLRKKATEMWRIILRYYFVVVPTACYVCMVRYTDKEYRNELRTCMFAEMFAETMFAEITTLTVCN